MEPTPCVTTSPHGGRASISIATADLTLADPAADYFSKLKCLDALTPPVGPTTTTSPSRRASTQMRTKGNPSAFLGIFHFFAQAYFALPVVSKFRTFCQIPRPWIGCRRRQINTRSSTYSFANASSSSRTSWPINVRSTSFSCVCRKMGNPVWPSCQNFLTEIVV